MALDPLFRREAAREMAIARRGVRELVEGVALEDINLVLHGMRLLQSHHWLNSGWRRAITRIDRLPPPSPRFRREFRLLWVRDGDLLRSDFPHDLDLIAFARLLLPPYSGPARTLWRGEGWLNRVHRTYGLSWTSWRGVAEDFARSRAERSHPNTPIRRSRLRCRRTGSASRALVERRTNNSN